MKNSFVTDGTSNLVNFFAFKRKMQIHEKRLKQVQPTLCTVRQPTSRSGNLIKKQPLAEFNRIITIDIQNKALLKKLTEKSHKKSQPKPYKLQKNNRRKIYEQYNKRVQNEGLLKRLKQVKSSYQAERYASQRKATQKYINNITKFGYKDYTPNKTLILPECIRPNTQQTKHNMEKSLVNKQKDLYWEENSPQYKNEQYPDTILKIEKRKLGLGKFEGVVTYIVWSTKLTVQINLSQKEPIFLEMPAHIFFQQFSQNIQFVHQNIRQNPHTGQFCIAAIS